MKSVTMGGGDEPFNGNSDMDARKLDQQEVCTQ